MKQNRVVSSIACRAASLPDLSQMVTYCADLLLALLAVATVSLLAALMLALLSAAPLPVQLQQ